MSRPVESETPVAASATAVAAKEDEIQTLQDQLKETTLDEEKAEAVASEESFEPVSKRTLKVLSNVIQGQADKDTFAFWERTIKPVLTGTLEERMAILPDRNTTIRQMVANFQARGTDADTAALLAVLAYDFQRHNLCAQLRLPSPTTDYLMDKYKTQRETLEKEHEKERKLALLMGGKRMFATPVVIKILDQVVNELMEEKYKELEQVEKEEEREEEVVHSDAPFLQATQQAYEKRVSPKDRAKGRDNFLELRKREKAFEQAKIVTLSDVQKRMYEETQLVEAALHSQWSRDHSTFQMHKERREKRMDFFVSLMALISDELHRIVQYNVERGCSWRDPKTGRIDHSKKISEPGTPCVLLVSCPPESHFERMSSWSLFERAIVVPITELQSFLRGESQRQEELLEMLSDPKAAQALIDAAKDCDFKDRYIYGLRVQSVALGSRDERTPRVRNPHVQFVVGEQKADACLEQRKTGVSFISLLFQNKTPRPVRVCGVQECHAFCWIPNGKKEFLSCGRCNTDEDKVVFCSQRCKTYHIKKEHEPTQRVAAAALEPAHASSHTREDALLVSAKETLAFLEAVESTPAARATMKFIRTTTAELQALRAEKEEMKKEIQRLRNEKGESTSSPSRGSVHEEAFRGWEPTERQKKVDAIRAMNPDIPLVTDYERRDTFRSHSLETEPSLEGLFGYRVVSEAEAVPEAFDVHFVNAQGLAFHLPNGLPSTWEETSPLVLAPRIRALRTSEYPKWHTLPPLIIRDVPFTTREQLVSALKFLVPVPRIPLTETNAKDMQILASLGCLGLLQDIMVAKSEELARIHACIEIAEKGSQSTDDLIRAEEIKSKSPSPPPLEEASVSAAAATSM